jgi:AraC-like DNA-binding protein/mannose-6-phosphate isomerase-like protein (cupin superfamily)
MNKEFLKERITHGDALFPMDIHVSTQRAEIKEKLHCHWHEEFEFLVVTDGGAEFHINTANYKVHKGDGIFINTNQLHSASSIENLPCSFFAVVVSPVLLSSYTNDMIQQKYIDTVLDTEILFEPHIKAHTEWGDRILGLLSSIKDAYYKKDAAYELLIKTKLYEIWYQLLIHSCDTGIIKIKSNDYKVSRIKLILEFIQNNYSQKITLAELSGYINMSEGQFCRFFKKMAKMTAFDYINYYRINMSGILLKETDKKISEIASNVGFNNISYFTKTFRKFMHCSPVEFKRKPL